jgi:CRP/FNR family transcriptional regulator
MISGLLPPVIDLFATTGTLPRNKTGIFQMAVSLQNCMFFKNLSDGSRRDLEAACMLQSFKKNDMLFMEGQKADALYCLREGAVQLSKMSAEGREAVVKTVAPGEVFAEVILFESDAYPVTATAMNDVVVVQIPRREFMKRLDQPAFRDEFIAGLMNKMRYLAQRILSLTTYDVEERFVRFLQQQYGPGPVFNVDMSKKDIAAAIGATPETLSRLILRLTKRSQLEWKDSSVRLSPELLDVYLDAE